MTTPTCKSCGEAHYNFQVCRPREDVKPAVKWADKRGWGSTFRDAETYMWHKNGLDWKSSGG